MIKILKLITTTITSLFILQMANAQTTSEKSIQKQIGKSFILEGLPQPIVLQECNIAFNNVSKKNKEK